MSQATETIQNLKNCIQILKFEIADLKGTIKMWERLHAKPEDDAQTN